MKGSVVLEIVGFADDVTGPLADSLGIPPELLSAGRCGCDRPRWSVLACGHCACRCECDDCPENRIWRVRTALEEASWCGCDAPGREVLDCGHCACGNGLCVEWVNVGDDRPFEKRRKASCA